MYRLALVVACVATLGMPSLAAQSRELPPDAVPKTSCHKAIAQQNRINTYFHRGVVPKLLRCWSGLRGSGTVAATFPFQRSGDYWVPGSSRLRGSSLAATDDGAAALRCLDAAMAGTAFPVEASDAEATAMNVNWSFPVPMPADLNAAAQRMMDGGGGPAPNECGGTEGPDMACVDCYYVPIVGISLCGRSCTGYSGCSTPQSHGCTMDLPLCVTGSLFGNIGGLRIY